MSHLSQTLKQVLLDEKYSQKAFSEDRNLDRSLVNRFLTGDRLLVGEIKAAIFTKWDNPDIEQALFGAHIRDEIQASGLSVEVNLKSKD